MPVKWKDSMGNWKHGSFHEYTSNIRSKRGYVVFYDVDLGGKMYKFNSFVPYDNDTLELDELKIDADKYNL